MASFTIYQQKLGVMRRVMSLAAISRETGIPRKVLTGLTTGAEKLSGSYLKKFNNLYAKTSYSYLRGVGVPSSIASRFRGGAASTVEKVYDQFVSKLEYYTTGAAMAKARLMESQGKTISMSKLYDELLERVREGMSRSKMSYDDLLVKDKY